jgi:hypothetical protein
VTSPNLQLETQIWPIFSRMRPQVINRTSQMHRKPQAANEAKQPAARCCARLGRFAKLGAAGEQRGVNEFAVVT